jgi:hypothetical protein
VRNPLPAKLAGALQNSGRVPPVHRFPSAGLATRATGVIDYYLSLRNDHSDVSYSSVCFRQGTRGHQSASAAEPE